MTSPDPIFSDSATDTLVEEIAQGICIDEGKGPTRPLDEILDDHGRRGGPSKAGWSSRSDRYTCPRRAKLEDRFGRAPLTSMAPVVGSIVHEYLAAYYEAHKDGKPVDEVLAFVEAVHNDLIDARWDAAATESRRIWDAYYTKYGVDPSKDSYLRGCKVVGIETEFARTFPWGGLYTARADLVLEAPDGIIIVDHKTTDRRDSSFIEGWIVSPQMLGLQWLATRRYKNVVGYSINGIIRTAKVGLERMMFASNPGLVRDWLRMMRYRETETQLAALAGGPPNFSACMARGRSRCPFFDYCAHGIRPDRVGKRRR